MAEISVGAAVGAGFDLIRRRPVSVLTWGLLEVLGLGAVLGSYAGMLINMFAALPHNGGSTVMPPAEIGRAVGGMLMGEGFMFLAVIGMVILRGVVMAGVWRAVLHPEARRWAYLRFGKAELFILLLIFAVGMAANFAVIPLLPVLMVVGGLIAFRQWIAAAIVGVLAIVLFIGAVIYFELRFAFVGPMIVDDDNFHLMESWHATRGNVGSLFFIGLSIFGVLMVAEVLVLVLVLIILGLGIGFAAGGFENLQALAQQQPLTVVAKLAPFAGLLALLSVPLAGGFTAVIAAPWASAYRGTRPDASAAFA